MARVVIILGAGASAEAGAPMMDSFLERIEDLRREPPQELNKADFELVSQAIGQLRSVHAKASFNPNNLESVFSIIEMGAMVGRLGPLPPQDIERLPGAMRRVLAQVIEHSALYPKVEGMAQPHESYRSFVRAAIKGEDPYDEYRKDVAIVTFNYDVCLDFALFKAGVPINYGLTSEVTSGLKLLKLHGSLNWIHCQHCNAVQPWVLKVAAAQLRAGFLVLDRPSTPGSASLFRMCLETNATLFSCCNYGDGKTPFIVPPTWQKMSYAPFLKPVWRAAATELQDAEVIIVCGYSLPVTDSFFKDLYALGVMSPVRIRRFVVVDPSREAADRFRSLLGPEIPGTRFVHHSSTFHDLHVMLQGFLR